MLLYLSGLAHKLKKNIYDRYNMHYISSWFETGFSINGKVKHLSNLLYEMNLTPLEYLS